MYSVGRRVSRPKTPARGWDEQAGSVPAKALLDEAIGSFTVAPMHPLKALLAERDWVLADGAMGTNLFALGLTGGASGERWNLDEPARVASVHQDMVTAGADIILTNTFGANRYRLALHGLGERAMEVNECGAAIACRVADTTDRTVVVAGSMGPTGDVLEPLGPTPKRSTPSPNRPRDCGGAASTWRGLRRCTQRTSSRPRFRQ